MSKVAKVTDSSQFVHGKWSVLPVTYTTRDLLLYAVSIGCAKESRTAHNSNHSDLRFIYELHKDFAAFPTYPVLLMQKGATQNVDTVASAKWYLGKAIHKPGLTMYDPIINYPKFQGTKAGVDAERYIERVKSLPTDSVPKLNVRTRLIGVHKKGSGALVEKESELYGEDGQVYYKFSTGDFQIGAKNFTDVGRTNADKVPSQTRAPDATVELETTPEQAHMYRLNSDYNPLHIDPAFSKMGGFPAPILHGLCTLGHAARAVLIGMAGNNANRFHALKLRFASPVIPGDTLVTEMWKLPEAEANKLKIPLPVGCDRIVFVTKNKATGKPVISNAFMDILQAPQARL